MNLEKAKQVWIGWQHNFLIIVLICFSILTVMQYNYLAHKKDIDFYALSIKDQEEYKSLHHKVRVLRSSLYDEESRALSTGDTRFYFYLLGEINTNYKLQNVILSKAPHTSKVLWFYKKIGAVK